MAISQLYKSIPREIIFQNHQEFLENPTQPLNLHPNFSSSTAETDIHDESRMSFDIEDNDENDAEDTFLTNLALFYLRMQAKMLLPATTIQSLIEEFQQVHDSNMDHIFSKLRDELTKLNMSVIDIDGIIAGLNKSNLLRLYNEEVIRSDETRKTYFKRNFNYVPPKKVYLGKNAKGNDRFLQYVPIKETLKVLLSHESVKTQYTEAKTHSSDDPHLLEDVRDGRNFKDKEIFQQCMSSASIILYQDSFEVVNHFGSGRKKHKQLAVYMSLS